MQDFMIIAGSSLVVASVAIWLAHHGASSVHFSKTQSQIDNNADQTATIYLRSAALLVRDCRITLTVSN
jgi:NAD-dependent SIR2 family protein deacetylase